MNGENFGGRKRLWSTDGNGRGESRFKLEHISAPMRSCSPSMDAHKSLTSSYSVISIPKLSPSCSPSSTPWQHPSSSQCVNCKKIACSCHFPRLNPEETRRRLEKLRLNTPYEKAKAIRYTETLQFAERKQRQQIECLWKQFQNELHQHYASLYNSHVLVESEEYMRNTLLSNEAHEKELLVINWEGERLFLQLHQLEWRSRFAVRATEERERLALRKEIEFASVAQCFFQKELHARAELVMQEESERAMWYSQRAREGAIMETSLLLVHRLYTEMRTERDSLHQLWSDEREEMITQWEKICHQYYANEQERNRHVSTFLRSLKELQSMEEATWKKLLEWLEEGLLILHQRERKLKEKQKKLSQRESESRCALMESRELELAELACRMQRDVLMRQRLLEERERKWCLEMNAAITAKEMVVKDEESAFLQLLQREREDYECCSQKVQESVRYQLAQLDLVSTAVHCEIEQQEEEYRKVLRQQFVDEYELRIQWKALRHKQVETFFLSESMEREEILKLEYHGFFSFYTLKAEDEIITHRQIEQKRKERLAVSTEEEKARYSFSMMEEYEREYLSIASARALERMATFIKQQHEFVTNLEQSELSFRGAIVREEEDARKDLHKLCVQSSFGALKLQMCRLWCELEGEECRQRQYYIQEELVAWGQLVSLLDISTRSRIQKNILRLKAELQEIESEETAKRSKAILESEEEWLKLVEEKHRQQSIIESQSGPKEAGTIVTSLRERLVRETLNLSEALSHPLVDYAAEVIEFFHCLHNAAKSRRNRTALAAESVARQLQSLESQVIEKTEQRQRYVEKLTRDQEEVLHIENALKEDQKRFLKELQLEKQKLQIAEKELRNNNTVLLSKQEAVRAFLKGS